MTRAIFYRDSKQHITGFVVTGHAGANQDKKSSLLKRVKASSQTYDLVCAAISAICFTALGGLDELCGVHDFDESDGDLRFQLPTELTPSVAETAQIILKTMEIGLKQVEVDYQPHITVVCKEV